jgi:hypothetical protein
MRSLQLDFVTRVKLIGIVGGAQAQDGGIGKLHALLKVFELVRFSPEELEQITVTPVDEKTANYRITDPEQSGPEFGRKTVAVEEAQAEWLRLQVKFWSSSATIHDLVWLDPLIEALESRVEREPKAEAKRKKA